MSDTMVNTETVKDAVILACRAPSLHNSQPWRRRRVLRRTDRSGREALISGGVVLDHLRVALAAAGWKANVNRFPNPNKPAAFGVDRARADGLRH
jgi:nitroreductase